MVGIDERFDVDVTTYTQIITDIIGGDLDTLKKYKTQYETDIHPCRHVKICDYNVLDTCTSECVHTGQDLFMLASVANADGFIDFVKVGTDKLLFKFRFHPDIIISNSNEGLPPPTFSFMQHVLLLALKRYKKTNNIDNLLGYVVALHGLKFDFDAPIPTGAHQEETNIAIDELSNICEGFLNDNPKNNSEEEETEEETETVPEVETETVPEEETETVPDENNPGDTD